MTLNSSRKRMRIILYANDIVIFVANKILNRVDMDDVLNKVINQLAAWFKNNQVVNMKKSKSECILFGIRQKLSAFRENLRSLTA